MKIAILIPIHKTMEAACVQSLVNFQCELHNAGHNTLFYFAYGFNAVRARQGLVRESSENKHFIADYVLWLDSDHLYLKKDFDLLLKTIEEKNLELCSGTYKMRGSEETCHGINKNGGFYHYHYKELNEKPDELFEADVVGFGFLLMKGAFLKGMWEKYGDKLFEMDLKDFGTEDAKFCKLTQGEGHKIYFHPQARIGHTELCIRI